MNEQTSEEKATKDPLSGLSLMDHANDEKDDNESLLFASCVFFIDQPFLNF